MIALTGIVALVLAMIALADARFVVPMIVVLALVLGISSLLLAGVTAWRGRCAANTSGDVSTIGRIVTLENLGLLAASFFLLFCAIIMDGHSPGEIKNFLFDMATWKHLIQELAFALLIAFLIIISIERRSRHEMKADYESRLKGMQLNAISAVFGINSDRKLVDRVFNMILGDPFYRWSQHTALEFREVMIESSSGVPTPFLVMSVSISYQLENRSATSREYPIVLAIEKFNIRGVGFDENRVAAHSSIGTVHAGNSKIKLNEEEQATVTLYKGKMQIAAGEKVPVSLSFNSVRRCEDSEYFWIKHPCDSMTVDIRLPSDDYIIDSYSPTGDLVCTLDTGPRRVWRLDGPILPNEGIYVSWQRSNVVCQVPASTSTGESKEKTDANSPPPSE